MTDVRQSASLADLLGSLVSDLSTLFRKEVQLARAEAGEKVEQVMGAGRSIAIGAVLAIGAVGVLLAAIVSILAAWFVALGMSATLASALSGFIVAVIIGAVAWAMIAGGIKAVRATSLQPQHTARAVSEDIHAVQERF